MHDRVELLGARQVVAEGLLDDGAPPRALRRVGQAVRLQLLHHLREELRRHRQVEGEVAAGPLLLVELLDGLAELLEGVVVDELALDEAHALGQLRPDLLAEGGARVLLDRVVDDLGEVLVLPVAAGEADQREARRQQPPVGQVVDGRHQLLAGQVTGDAEDDQARGPGDARQPPVRRIPERVEPGQGLAWVVLQDGRVVVAHCAEPPFRVNFCSDAETVSRSSFQDASNFSTPSSSSSWTTSS